MESMAGKGLVLELLMGGLASTLRGHGRYYGLSGPSGIGKTHLLKVLERTADELGFTILRGTGTPKEPPHRCSLLCSLDPHRHPQTPPCPFS